MKPKLLGTIWVCIDCMLVEANGECDPDRPADRPVPLSTIGEGTRVTLGMMSGDHHEECPVRITGDHNAAECDCERKEFDTWPCGACGDWLHGTRHAMTLWLERHVITEHGYGGDGRVRRAVCSCGDVSMPMGERTLAEVASGHAVDGELIASPSWGGPF